MKKLASLLLVLVMITSCFSAMAVMEGTLDNGSITINNAVPSHTYKAYQILYLESYNDVDGDGKDADDAYAYKANTAWATWLDDQSAYVAIDTQGYVTWVKDADAAAFAKAAQAHAATLDKADKTAVAPAATGDAEYSTVEITDLTLGYYLIDTNLGTLCSLDTTNPTVVMYEKNEKPTIDKLVQEDSNQSWGESNTAEIGDTVKYKTTINAHPGAQNYILHDKMTEGLTLNQESISIEGLTKNNDYTVTFNTTDGCDFEITFTETYLDSITAATTLTLTYNAILNDKAVISTESNDNETYLEYGDMVNGKPEFKTPGEETKTYTFNFGLVKTTNDKKVLTGAEFELYDAPTNGNKIPLVKEADGTYRVATDEESNAKDGEDNPTFTSAIIEAGSATIEGLDANTTYYLEEITAPAGYNKLADRHPVEILENNLTANVAEGVYQDGGVQVINQTGAELPSTGGMGTTLLYVGGGILVLAAIVLLIVKRRTTAE